MNTKSRSYLSHLALSLILAGGFFGCKKEDNDGNDDDSTTSGDESTGDGSTDDGGDTTDDSGDSTDDGGDTTDDSGDSTDDGGDTTDDSGDSTDDGGDTTDDSGDSTDDGGDTTDDSGDSTDDGGDTTDDGGDTTTGGDGECPSGEEEDPCPEYTACVQSKCETQYEECHGDILNGNPGGACSNAYDCVDDCGECEAVGYDTWSACTMACSSEWQKEPCMSCTTTLALCAGTNCLTELQACADSQGTTG